MIRPIATALLAALALLPTAVHADTLTSLVGDKDNFGTGFPPGTGFADFHMGIDSPASDFDRPPQGWCGQASFAWSHTFALPPGAALLGAHLTIPSFDMEDAGGGDGMGGGPFDDLLFLDGVEVPGAFDDVFSPDGALVVPNVSTFDLGGYLGALEDGQLDVVVSAVGGQFGDCTAIDYGELVIAFSPDSDGDGTADNTDNCPTVANPRQEDCDMDGRGDACDDDADNLVANGSFEQPLVCFAYLDSIPGWTKTRGDVIETHCDGLGAPADGSQYVELDGHPIHGQPPSITLEQTVATVPGLKYTARFSLRARCGTGGAGDNAAALSWDGHDVAAAATADCERWQVVSACVEATGETTRIALRDTAAQNSVGSLVDAVQVFADADCDGVSDCHDSCPDVANGDQADADGDTQGDACDSDDDNDGVEDPVDNCVFTPNGDQADFDADGLGDACDGDDDNDGVADGDDPCAYLSNPYAPGIAPTAVVTRGAVLGAGVYIGPGATIAFGAVLGDGVSVEAGAVVGKYARLGAGTVVRAGAKTDSGTVIGRCVEIGAGAWLRMSAFADDDAKVGPRNVFGTWAGVGAGSVTAADVVLGGSSSTGRRARLGAGAVLGARSHAGDDLWLGAGANVAADVALGARLSLGDRTRVGTRSAWGSDTRFGSDGVIDAYTVVGSNVWAGDHVIVRAGFVADGAVIPSNTTLP